MTAPIKKTLSTTLILLALYTLYTVYIGPDTYTQQQQWQENAIKAQHYLFKPTPKSVIVGSSLSAKLTNVLPNYYNLAFHGKGDCDGLRIILEKSELPDTVFIEMNTLLVPEDEAFTANITNPALNVVRKNVLPFREGKQPLPLVVSKMDQAVKSFRGDVKGTNSRGKAMANQLLAAQIKKYNVAPSAEVVQSATAKLRRYVDALIARNVTVIFFELPVHPKIVRPAT